MCSCDNLCEKKDLFSTTWNPILYCKAKMKYKFGNFEMQTYIYI